MFLRPCSCSCLIFPFHFPPIYQNSRRETQSLKLFPKFFVESKWKLHHWIWTANANEQGHCGILTIWNHPREMVWIRKEKKIKMEGKINNEFKRIDGVQLFRNKSINLTMLRLGNSEIEKKYETRIEILIRLTIFTTTRVLEGGTV